MAPRKHRLKLVAKRFAYVAGALLIVMVIFDMIIMPLYVDQGKTTQVPDVVGMPVDSANRLLRESDLEPYRSEVRFDRTYPEARSQHRIRPRARL